MDNNKFFEVRRQHTIPFDSSHYKVYGIRTNYNSSGNELIEFLLFIDDKWKWHDANIFKPISNY